MKTKNAPGREHSPIQWYRFYLKIFDRIVCNFCKFLAFLFLFREVATENDFGLQVYQLARMYETIIYQSEYYISMNNSILLNKTYFLTSIPSPLSRTLYLADLAWWLLFINRKENTHSWVFSINLTQVYQATSLGIDIISQIWEWSFVQTQRFIKSLRYDVEADR